MERRSGLHQQRQWTVYDGVKLPAPSPESLMSEIDVAIKKLEYSRATSLLQGSSPGQIPNPQSKSISISNKMNHEYDAKKADEAYRAGCAALAAGKLDEALHFLNISLSNCPPDKTSAVAKLQSLISLTSHHLHRSPSPISPL